MDFYLISRGAFVTGSKAATPTPEICLICSSIFWESASGTERCNITLDAMTASKPVSLFISEATSLVFVLFRTTTHMTISDLLVGCRRADYQYITKYKIECQIELKK
jgi:hypothetical protein